MGYEMTADYFMECIRGYVGKTKYAKGFFGQRLTLAKLSEVARRYPEWYNARCSVPGQSGMTNYQYLRQFCDGNWFAADCCGLIKGVRAGYRADGTVGHMTSRIDRPIEEMVAELRDVVKDVFKAEAGEMIFFKNNGHVMVVSQKGKMDIESAPSCDGVKEVKIGYQPLSSLGGAGKLPWVDYGDRPFVIEEDGIWGSETTRKAQTVFGTYIDGIVSRQLAKYKSICKGAWGGWNWTGTSGDKGSDLIRAMQKWLGVDVDGHIGPQTIKALQKAMGTPVDGVLDRPSQCIRAFQRWLNKEGIHEN